MKRVLKNERVHARIVGMHEVGQGRDAGRKCVRGNRSGAIVFTGGRDRPRHDSTVKSGSGDARLWT